MAHVSFLTINRPLVSFLTYRASTRRFPYIQKSVFAHKQLFTLSLQENAILLHLLPPLPLPFTLYFSLCILRYSFIPPVHGIQYLHLPKDQLAPHCHCCIEYWSSARDCAILSYFFQSLMRSSRSLLSPLSMSPLIIRPAYHRNSQLTSYS